jgi:hypothetical protein
MLVQVDYTKDARWNVWNQEALKHFLDRWNQEALKHFLDKQTRTGAGPVSLAANGLHREQKPMLITGTIPALWWNPITTPKMPMTASLSDAKPDLYDLDMLFGGCT